MINPNTVHAAISINVSWFMFLLSVLFSLSCRSLCSCFPCISSLCFFPGGCFCSPPPMADEAHLPCIHWQSTHYIDPPWTSLQCQSILSVRLSGVPLVIFDSGLFVFALLSVLSFFCYLDVFLECWDKFPFPLLVVLCVLLLVSSQTILVDFVYLICFCIGDPFCDPWQKVWSFLLL